MTQEKLAEAADLSAQTINDIEGCRMWVSDKTIIKLAQVLYIDAYELFTPMTSNEAQSPQDINKNEFLCELEGRIIRTVKQQFEEAKKQARDADIT